MDEMSSRNDGNSDPVDDSFERELGSTMKRVMAPTTFAASVMAAVEAEQHTAPGHAANFIAMSRGKVLAFTRPPVWVVSALAAVLVLSISFGEAAHVRYQRERAEATQQFETATRITNETLAHTRAQLRRAGVDIDQ